jgi:hypothetical protein
MWASPFIPVVQLPDHWNGGVEVGGGVMKGGLFASPLVFVMEFSRSWLGLAAQVAFGVVERPAAAD